MKQSKYQFSNSHSLSTIVPFNYEKITNLGKKIEGSKKHLYIFLRKTHQPTGFISNKSECIPLLSQLGFMFVHRIIEKFPIHIYGMSKDEKELAYGEYMVIEGRNDISGIFSSLPEKLKQDINFFELKKISFFNVTRTSAGQKNICDYRIVIETETSKNAVSFSICKFKDYFSILELAQAHKIKLKFTRVRPDPTKADEIVKIPVNTDSRKSFLVSSSSAGSKSTQEESPGSFDLSNNEEITALVDSKHFITLGKELIFERVDYFFYLKILVEGKEFIKHSTGSFKMQSRRKVFFTGDLEYICWTKPGSMVIKKKFKASDIEGWTYGRSTKNFLRFKPADDSSLRNSFSILLPYRTIDLEAYCYDDLRDFCKGINLLPELSKVNLL